jgi:hypothetical protein
MPILMAIVGVWLEHTWLRPDRRKRILLVEEAWHIINSPSVAQLFQRLLKFGRRLGLSFVAVVHHLSDVIDGAAAKEAAAILKMASTRTIYMQKSDEARATGRVLGLPRWAVEIIPTLSPGIAVWDVNGDVQVVKHIVTEYEKPLVYTDRAMTESSARPEVDAGPAAYAPSLPPAPPTLEPVVPAVARALPPTRAVSAMQQLRAAQSQQAAKTPPTTQASKTQRVPQPSQPSQTPADLRTEALPQTVAPRRSAERRAEPEPLESEPLESELAEAEPTRPPVRDAPAVAGPGDVGGEKDEEPDDEPDEEIDPELEARFAVLPDQDAPTLSPVPPPALATARPAADDPELTALAAALFGPRAQTPSHPRPAGPGNPGRGGTAR